MSALTLRKPPVLTLRKAPPLSGHTLRNVVLRKP